MHFQLHRFFQIEVPMFPLILVTIGQIVETLQQFFEIQDNDNRQLEFLKLCITNIIEMIEIEVSMFSQILVKIGQIVKKGQQFFTIQDGIGRHLELWLRRFFEVTDVF